ncbi:COP9 signalosome (CSN) subunit [Scheffersomyces spartinae]|uniref:COP9 signalosome (CSN) subunit n=1 Tax=Scheffersomyces spartinae TaxID=45513 RepID=A0A9P7VDN7_9ASCO|nr:COP9 signalosome (CSN) subunit [Scheffersomyces spartinae]KAG7195401.1 COP9 signalosome (CSN) subunit [Scheffersomyces spartinae]
MAYNGKSSSLAGSGFKVEDYLTTFLTAITSNNAQLLIDCVSIYPNNPPGDIRANLVVNEFDFGYLPEKYRPVALAHFEVMRAIHKKKNLQDVFVQLIKLTDCTIKAAETEDSWINPVVIHLCETLVTTLGVRNRMAQRDNNKKSVKGSSITANCELVVTTINKALKQALSDKNSDLKTSKRNDIYFFAGCLIKLYFKLGKYELAQSIERAIHGTRFPIPNIRDYQFKKYSVIYLYYTALLALDANELNKAQDNLSLAFHLITFYKSKPKPSNKQTMRILLLLIPLSLLNNRLLPAERVYQDYPVIKYIFQDRLLKAICTGDIQLFDKSINEFQLLFLRNHIYILVPGLRSLCYYKLIKKTAMLVKELNLDSASSHIVPLNAFQKSISFASSSSKTSNVVGVEVPLAEIECILANLIFDGKVKGYLSHTNKCIVLSKVDGFPKTLIK